MTLAVMLISLGIMLIWIGYTRYKEQKGMKELWELDEEQYDTSGKKHR
jgi:hypothetical protein